MRVFLNRLDQSSELINLDSKEAILEFVEQYSQNGQQLVCQGSILNATNALEINDFANVFETAGLEGGKRKKKKKVYTTKKKNKHIHKRIKNLTLSLYSVDAKGVVTQQRKTCPNCGPGTFMAQHWDRYYCGLCHMTIQMDPETVKKNEEIMKKKRAALEAERKAKEKEDASKAPAKKDAKKGKKK